VSLLRRLGLLLAVEGVVLVVVGVTYGVVSVDATQAAPAELAAGAAVVTGALLLLLARAAAHGKRWARSPAVVLNIFPLPLALSAVQSDTWYVAVPMVLLAGSVLYLFATPELREAFREG
jgi:hypothetical protein